jgi:hypothetical protein
MILAVQPVPCAAGEGGTGHSVAGEWLVTAVMPTKELMDTFVICREGGGFVCEVHVQSASSWPREWARRQQQRYAEAQACIRRHLGLPISTEGRAPAGQQPPLTPPPTQ